MAALVGHSRHHYSRHSTLYHSSSEEVDHQHYSSSSSNHYQSVEHWWDHATHALVTRCRRKYHWTQALAHRCLKGYRQFMELKTVMNDWNDRQLAAPLPVLAMWEEHILDSMRYAEDCVFLFGQVIGHDPDAPFQEDRAWVDRIKTTRIAFQARFANDMDTEVWDWGDVEYGTNETAPMNVDYGEATTHAPVRGVTPVTLGRLPVAPPVDRNRETSKRHAPVTARTTAPPRTVGLSTEDDDDDDDNNDVRFPRRYTRSVSPTRAKSPAHRSASPVRSSPRPSTSLSPKPNTPTGNDPITIYLKDTETGDQTYFSLRYRIPFRVMFAVYAERKNVNQDKLEFSYQGQPLTGFETPFSIGMEDGEHIDVQHKGRR